MRGWSVDCLEYGQHTEHSTTATICKNMMYNVNVCICCMSLSASTNICFLSFCVALLVYIYVEVLSVSPAACTCVGVFYILLAYISILCSIF